MAQNGKADVYFSHLVKALVNLHAGALIVTLLFLLLIINSCNKAGNVDEEGVPEVVDFNRDVRRILSDTCFACHGPDEMARSTDLRLDMEESAFTALDDEGSRFAIVRGKPGDSELYARLISSDPVYMMPPPESNLSLDERQIAILKKWIAQGAEYKPHWAFIPPEKPPLPRVNNREWPQNPIDHFVLAKLEERGMHPSPEVDREKLLRRVSFDLTGLPPTVEELDRFLSDDSPDAWEKVVDRLLASEAYGERMATEWLDVARYADSHGYQDDAPNELWPWRDWVIDAFNRNMPFDRFTTWQLAGDLLPDATREQRLATGFGRAHPQNQEAGSIDEEYRVEYVANRVQTTSTAFMGLTMQCARCHDHKYDPISIKEYYEFFSFFDNINETGVIPGAGAEGGRLVLPGPTLQLPSHEAEERIKYLEDAIADQEQRMSTLQPEKEEALLGWNSQPKSLNPIRPESHGMYAQLTLDDVHDDEISVNRVDSTTSASVTGTLHKKNGVHGTALKFEKGNSINLGDIGRFERSDPFSFSFWVQPEDSNVEAPVLVRTGRMQIGYRGYDISLFDNKVSFRLIHGWPYNAIQVISREALSADDWNHVAVIYDGSSQASGIRIFINGRPAETRVEHDNLFKNIRIEKEEPRYPRQNFLIGERESFDALKYKGFTLDEVKIFNRLLSELEVLALAGSDTFAELQNMSPEEHSDFQKQVLFNHYLLHLDADYDRYMNDLHELRTEKSSIRDTLRDVMVMQERINSRTTYIRERGMYDQLGEEVSPGVPSSILPFPDDLPRNRLGLAKWLLSPEHPLTSRVTVNRYWQLFFGTGLVNTPDDFGNQGSMPSHPELLDWLAVSFRENGWNLKELHKIIVMSQTYRQSSALNPEILERDPQNRWLSRGPRHRLSAEMIRDNALATSGLLVDGIGGPSVFPYQPDGLWEETTSGRHLTEYIQDEGESLYRRSLYTFWKRTSPPPGMTTFDAAMRTHPTVQRQTTSTPLQALHTMNDPIYVESSRLLAERMMKEGGDELHDQITFAFRAVTSRKPANPEIDILTALYNDELASFSAEPERADKLLSVGDFPADETLEGHELAARTIVASTILNLHETLTKE